MLLKKIRLGINPVAEGSRVQQVTARFDAAHDSVVRTPVLMPHAPVTPLPAVLGDKAPGTPLPAAGPTGESLHGGPGVSGYTVAQGSNSLQCKDEPEFADACVAASVELHPFGGDIHELGLVQIDSSSGSDLTLAVAQTVIQVPVNMSPTQCHDQHTLSTCLMSSATMCTRRATSSTSASVGSLQPCAKRN